MVSRGRKRGAGQRERDAAAWTLERRAGRSVTSIAVEAGVSAATVSRATSVGGRFNRRGVDEETVRAWAARRRLGETVQGIAGQAGMSEAAVGSLTRVYGPFPRGRPTAPSTAGQWAEQRRAPVRGV